LELGADEGDSESEGESEGPRQIGEWTLEDGPAPAVPVEMTPVMSAQLDVSVRDFYERFLADQVPLPLVSTKPDLGWRTQARNEEFSTFGSGIAAPWLQVCSCYHSDAEPRKD
jgi:hypothetical protein